MRRAEADRTAIACDDDTSSGTEAAASAAPRVADLADSLAYIADMIQELRVLAERGDSETLGLILGVAQREAEIQADRWRDGRRNTGAR